MVPDNTAVAGLFTTPAQARAAQLTSCLQSAPQLDTSSVQDTLAWANQLQDAGLHLFPVKPGAKQPLLPSWPDLATTDHDEMGRVLRAAQHPNLGVQLGASHLCVLDADTPEQVQQLSQWYSNHNPGQSLPPATVATPGSQEQAHHGGGHWWVVLPAGMEAKQARLGLPPTGPDSPVAMAGRKYVLLAGSHRTDVADPAHAHYTVTGPVYTLQDFPGLPQALEPATRPERSVVPTDSPATGTQATDPATQWGMDTSWTDLLLDHGWLATGETDSCGCDVWTAPGIHSSPKSATAHEGGCSQVKDEDGYLQVWTTSGTDSDELDAVVYDGNRQGATKLQFVAAMEYDGDTSAARQALGLYGSSGLAIGPADMGLPDTAVTPLPQPATRGLDTQDLDTELATQLEGLPEAVRKRVLEELTRKQASQFLSQWERASHGVVSEPVQALGADELLAMQFDTPRWLVEDLWPADTVAMVHAPAKVGKSRLVHYLVECLINGQPFAGAYPVNRPTGTIALLDLELSPRQLQDRLKALEFRHPEQLKVWPFYGKDSQLDLTDPQVCSQLVAQLKEQDTQVLVVDNLTVLIMASGLDENTEGAEAIRRLRAVAMEAGVESILLVDHRSYKGGGSVAAGPRGDSKKRDIIAVELALEPDEDNDVFNPATTDTYRLHVGGRVERPHTVELSMDGPRYLVSRTSRDTATQRVHKNAWDISSVVYKQLELIHQELVDKGKDGANTWPTRHALQQRVKPYVNMGRDRVLEAIDFLVSRDCLEAMNASRGSLSYRPTGTRLDNPYTEPDGAFNPFEKRGQN